MKPQSANNEKVTSGPGSATTTGARGGFGANRFGMGQGRLPGQLPLGQLPMEWMDPMSWRLPSGKALAEFALQAGFLAPLILSGPRGARSGAHSPGAHSDDKKAGSAAPDPRNSGGRMRTGLTKARESAR